MLVKSSAMNGRRVLVTGHTGFKGGWLALWLREMGADVTGLALPPTTTPSLFDQVRLDELVTHIEGDIRDADTVARVVRECRPEIVFHLAAQPLVRASYADPVGTYATNVMGTIHVLEACRAVESVKAVVGVTSDKCYENREWVWPYRESDPMGGHDPYSSSKGAAELAIASWRRSFFDNGALVASARAGNVIGGGDWADDRLIPDLVRAMLAGEAPSIRSPRAIRPWQHVLDALSGYMLLGLRLLEGDRSAATGWNFGPSSDDTRPVEFVAEEMIRRWGGLAWEQPQGTQPHEANLLSLDCAKARSELGWRPTLCLEDAIAMVVDWHRAVAEGADARSISLEQLRAYTAKMELERV